FTIKLTLASLLMFSLYLVFIIIKDGNRGNCGCFGNAIYMTPAQALVKNAIMFGVAILLWVFYDGFNCGKAGKFLMGATVIASFALPHILNYVDFDYSKAYLNKPEDHFKLELDSLYKDAKLNTPPQSLRQGKHIIAFMSATCPHCRIAAKKLRLFKEKNESLPIYIVLNGDDDKFKFFFEDTKATNIPYCKLNGRNFVYLAGLSMPMIYLVNNSTVETNVNYMELDQDEIEKWLEKP
ncbi:MAG: MauE/DoxX family redox-associated membrane protein, partial [Bacteroidia bacterium]